MKFLVLLLGFTLFAFAQLGHAQARPCCRVIDEGQTAGRLKSASAFRIACPAHKPSTKPVHTKSISSNMKPIFGPIVDHRPTSPAHAADPVHSPIHVTDWRVTTPTHIINVADWRVIAPTHVIWPSPTQGPGGGI